MSSTLALSHKEILQADRDYEKAALYAHLVYVNDRQPGIFRLKKGKGFRYVSGDRPVTDQRVLKRIRSMVIPPAWVIDSGMVNHYIKAAVGMDFTAKDFRTWAGSLHALLAFRSIGEATGVTDCKKNIVSVLDTVSRQLGNTRAVCKKYYVHPGLITLYEENKLLQYLADADVVESDPDLPVTGLNTEEKILMKILRRHMQKK
jgi:DNA topoisomerase IB